MDLEKGMFTFNIFYHWTWWFHQFRKQLILFLVNHVFKSWQKNFEFGRVFLLDCLFHASDIMVAAHGEDAGRVSQPAVIPKAGTQQPPPVDQPKAETKKRKINVVVKKPKVKKVINRRARTVSKRQGGQPHTRMGLDELKRRGDAALSTRDCAGAVTYYRKFLERAPNTHPERERVLTRVGSCQK